MQQMDQAGASNAPLHLKIRVYHADMTRSECEVSGLVISHLGDVLMPLLWYLKDIGPDGKRPLVGVMGQGS